MRLPGTIFLDIDGTIFKHRGSITNTALSNAELLPGVLEMLGRWDSAGYKIILITGRKESLRKKTEEDLARLGIVYDMLIMGLPNGPRIVINDTKSTSDKPTAFGISLPRNKGLEDLQQQFNDLEDNN